VKIALVQNSGAGDYFEQWTVGVRRQADAAGFEVQIYDAKADPGRQAADMKTAIESGVKGIIVDHGLAGTMCPLVRQATDAGIAVVVYDIEITECAPKAVETEQDDAQLATLVLTQMAKDVGDGVPVGYVNVLGIAPFDRRDVVWKKFVAEHEWAQKFFVGKFTHDVATDNARLVDAALKANPGVKAIRCLRRAGQGRHLGHRAERPFAQAGDVWDRHLERRHRADDKEGQPVESDWHRGSEGGRRRRHTHPRPPSGRSTRQQRSRVSRNPRHPVVPSREPDQEHGRLAGQDALIDSR
jgi:hypothetical protein